MLYACTYRSICRWLVVRSSADDRPTVVRLSGDRPNIKTLLMGTLMFLHRPIIDNSSPEILTHRMANWYQRHTSTSFFWTIRGDVKAFHQIIWPKTRIIGFIVRHFHKRTLTFDCHFASWWGMSTWHFVRNHWFFVSRDLLQRTFRTWPNLRL